MTVEALPRGEWHEADRVGDAIRLVLLGVVGAMLVGLFAWASVSSGTASAGVDDVTEAALITP